MKFGYVWNDPRAIGEESQRNHLDAAGAGARRILVETSPARGRRHRLIFSDRPLLRPGDALAVYRTRYLADDALDFIAVLARLAEIGAALHVIDLGVEFAPDRTMAAVMKNDLAERHKAQTAAAAEAWRKLPKSKRGGRKARKFTPEETRVFKRMWANKSVTLGDMAAKFGCSKPSVIRYAGRMNLPPRGT